MSKQWNCHHLNNETNVLKSKDFQSWWHFWHDSQCNDNYNIISYYRMEFYKSFGHEVSCILEFAISNKQFVIGILPDQSFLTEWEDYRVSSGPFWDLIWNWRLEFFEICLLKILERARSDLSLTFFWMFDRIHCFGD